MANKLQDYGMGLLIIMILLALTAWKVREVQTLKGRKK
jgi:hypothetical protein